MIEFLDNISCPAQTPAYRPTTTSTRPSSAPPAGATDDSTTAATTAATDTHKSDAGQVTFSTLLISAMMATGIYLRP